MRLAEDRTGSSTHHWALCILSNWKERGANYRPFLSLVNSLPAGSLCDVTAACLDTSRQELLQLSPEYLSITVLPESDICQHGDSDSGLTAPGDIRA
jgi:hypothetical protein